MTVTFRLERLDGASAEPSSFKTTVSPGGERSRWTTRRAGRAAGPGDRGTATEPVYPFG
jgi:hypothetical protein